MNGNLNDRVLNNRVDSASASNGIAFLDIISQGLH